MSYEGWKNYETWAVKLWLDNEEGSSRYWADATREAWENAEAETPFTRSERARHDLADQLKDEIDQNMPEAITEAVDGTLYSDLLNAALGEVCWQEIADAMLSYADADADEKHQYEPWKHATTV